MKGMDKCRWLFAFAVAIALSAMAPVVTYGQICPKLSPASLDLDTAGCPTTFDAVDVEKRTSWELQKTAAAPGPLLMRLPAPVMDLISR